MVPVVCQHDRGGLGNNVIIQPSTSNTSRIMDKDKPGLYGPNKMVVMVMMIMVMVMMVLLFAYMTVAVW